MFSERDWRDKLKAAEALKDTIEKQRADLERVRKEIGEKEMLCTTLRVNERKRERERGGQYEGKTMRER